MPRPTNAELIAGLYTAFFNRAPEAAGLAFWEGRFAGGDSVLQLAAGFAGHPVFEATYGGLDNQQFVEAVYVNVLGGPGDAGGISFWTDRLNSHGYTRDQMVAEFVFSALSDDLDAALARGELTRAEYDAAVQRQATLSNKAEVGVAYAKLLGELTNLHPATDASSKDSLEMDAAYFSAQSIIAHITDDPVSTRSAEALIGAMVEHLSAQDSTDGNLVFGRQANPGGTEIVVMPGMAGQQDHYLIDTQNFSQGDVIRLTNFEFDLDAVFFGEVYANRNVQPVRGDNRVLEIFVEQSGNDVRLSVEKAPDGGSFGNYVSVIVVGATVDELIPSGTLS